MAGKSPTSARPLVFRPAFALCVSLAGAALYLVYATLRFSGDKLSNQYYYVTPIVVPFVAFLLDRAEEPRRSSRTLRLLIDSLVVLTAVWRVIADVPYVSGHALFLIYASLSTRSRVAQIAAIVVMAEVIYLKFFVWHDWVTPTTGMLLGGAAALLRRRFGAASGKSSIT